MKVVVVSPWGIAHDHILRRMVAQRPWRMVAEPEPDCLNYFFPYQFWRETAGPTAALFSHDMGHPRWADAARGADVRIAWTRLYSEPLAANGPTRRIAPGLDHALFSPDGKVTAPIVGVAGLVYGDGRKGEDLWARLVVNEPGWTFRAAGQGWAGDCRPVPYAHMPSFLRGLNVLLCPSRVEGVPMPPLEALACGVKVVIPAGVGMMDDLPAMPGIVRFPAGDYAAMRRAVAEALVTAANPADLRAAVAGYTWQAWRDGHMEAFKEWL
jgi:hypothetical protein